LRLFLAPLCGFFASFAFNFLEQTANAARNTRCAKEHNSTKLNRDQTVRSISVNWPAKHSATERGKLMEQCWAQATAAALVWALLQAQSTAKPNGNL
jgi:hypothetical protein